MITPRLEMILRHIHTETVADIGTDHAYIPIELAEKGVKVIATDINRGPLESARANINKYEKNIELRLGAGLEPVGAGETESVIIAGMGGEMIINILKQSSEKAANTILVLQPMNYQNRLRKYLFENNYAVLCEDMEREKEKLYTLIVAADRKYLINNQKGRKIAEIYGVAQEVNTNISVPCEVNLHIPKILSEHPLYEFLVAKKRREFTKIYNGLATNPEKNKKKLEEIKKLLCDLDKLS